MGDARVDSLLIAWTWPLIRPLFALAGGFAILGETLSPQQVGSSEILLHVSFI